MNEQEMRELDAWIAEKVFGWKRGKMFGNGNGEWIVDDKGYKEGAPSWNMTPRYTADPAACSLVRKACFLKLREMGECVEVWYDENDLFGIMLNGKLTLAATEEICWCLFAKALFEKGPTC